MCLSSLFLLSLFLASLFLASLFRANRFRDSLFRVRGVSRIAFCINTRGAESPKSVFHVLFVYDEQRRCQNSRSLRTEPALASLCMCPLPTGYQGALCVQKAIYLPFVGFYLFLCMFFRPPVL